MPYPFETLLIAAGAAPSGDNTQPWRFLVDPADRTIDLVVHGARDPSPMNAGQRMARIALGAALENLLRSARDLGWDPRLENAPSPALARVRLRGDGDGDRPVDPTLAGRTTNRRPYDSRPVPPETLALLERETPDLEGVRAHWIVGADRLAAWANLIGRADAIMLGHPDMRRAFLEKVRFNADDRDRVPEGLSPASLELTPTDRLALRVMRHAPDRLLKLGGAGSIFRAKARQLVLSSSGLCLVVAPDDARQTDLLVGRVMQRAWLAMTAQGLAAQPMMSLLVLDNVLSHGDASLIRSLGRDRLAAMLDETRALAPEIGDGRPAFLIRFGVAAPPSGRSGRLPTSASVETAEPRDHQPRPAGLDGRPVAIPGRD